MSWSSELLLASRLVVPMLLAQNTYRGAHWSTEPLSAHRDKELRMVVLWTMSAVGLLVVAPVVVLLASYVIRPARECLRYADDILEHGVGVTVALEPVPALITTAEIVEAVTLNAVAYLGALRSLVAASAPPAPQ